MPIANTGEYINYFANVNLLIFVIGYYGLSMGLAYIARSLLDADSITIYPFYIRIKFRSGKSSRGSSGRIRPR